MNISIIFKIKKTKHTRTPIIHPNLTISILGFTSVCNGCSFGIITELIISLFKSIADANLNFDGIFAVPCNTSSVGRLFDSDAVNENTFL